MFAWNSSRPAAAPDESRASTHASAASVGAISVIPVSGAAWAWLLQARDEVGTQKKAEEGVFFCLLQRVNSQFPDRFQLCPSFQNRNIRHSKFQRVRARAPFYWRYLHCTGAISRPPDVAWVVSVKFHSITFNHLFCDFAVKKVHFVLSFQDVFPEVRNRWKPSLTTLFPLSRPVKFQLECGIEHDCILPVTSYF